MSINEPKATETAKKVRGKPFAKGDVRINRNPGGRPKIPAEFKEACKANGTELLLQLAQRAKVGALDDKLMLAVAQECLDRGYGKPTQHQEIDATVVDRRIMVDI